MHFSLLSIFKKNKTKITGDKKKHTPLRLFNSLSKIKETFDPIKPGMVSMYSCGPTVYDTAHIGNLRSFVFVDILRRTLEYSDYKVKHIINITDVGELSDEHSEDKMMLALKREHLPITLTEMKKVGSKYMKLFKEDIKELNIKTPFAFPRASEHILGQIAFIKTLEEKGYTYTLKDGVYFNTHMFKDYGALGGTTKDEESVSRIGTKEQKHSQQDFALWKFSENKTPSGKPLGWDSPWGIGTPGWHIECSAMSSQYLGKHIDIHTGGMDLASIHHNNEIAQAEAVTGKKYVQYWLHNAFINIDDQKISKSLGNTIRLQQIIDRGFSPLAYRYWLLTGHYRSPINFTWEALTGSQHALTRLQRIFVEDLGKENGEIDENYRKTFHRAINDDFDTPKAVALLWDLVKDDCLLKESKRATMLEFDKVLGIGFSEGVRKLKEMLSLNVVSLKDLPSHIKKLVADRGIARKAKNWEEADRLRTLIKKEGYTVKDTSKGPKVSKE